MIKRIIIGLLIVFVPLGILAALLGDVDNSGKIGASDYLLVRRHILGLTKLTGDSLTRADVNSDGKVNSSDYMLIRKAIINGTAIATPTTPSPSPTPIKYTVTFDSNGGSNVSNQQIEKNGKVVEPSNPKRSNYVFVEWQLNGKKYDFNTAVTSNIKLVAKWKEEQLGVILNIATFNVAGFMVAEPVKIADLIKNNGIDIVGIQEGRYYYEFGGPALANRINYNIASYTYPFQINAIISKKSYQVKSTSEIFLNSNCTDPFGESDRRITKAVLNINGVNVSIYSGHFGLGTCNELHFQSAVNQIKNDPNPAIVLADYNNTEIDYFNKYFVKNGFTIAAHDTTSHNIWGKVSYCDSILVSAKNHIKIRGSKTIDTYGSYSDHNLVIATLDIY